MRPKRTSLDDRTSLESTTAAVAVSESGQAGGAGLWEQEAARQEVILLDVTQIMPNPRQPRTIFDPAKLDELAASIQAHGVIQPVLVRPIALTKWDGHARRYELVAGERRWRASMLVGQTTIPALIRDDAGDHATLLELALIENLQRADLHPLEEGQALGAMRDTLGYSIRRIGERVGRSKGYVENRLKLLDHDAALQQLVSERPDTLMHVGELAKVTDAEARAALLAAVRDGLSYAETHARVRALQNPALPRPASNEGAGQTRHDRQHNQGHAPVSLADLSLRKDRHDRDADGGHGGSVAPAVGMLPPDGPSGAEEREQNGHHGYDDAANEHHVAQPSVAAEAPHERHQDGGDHTLLALSAHERRALAELAATLDGWGGTPARLVTADRELLASVAQRLQTLLRRLEPRGEYP